MLRTHARTQPVHFTTAAVPSVRQPARSGDQPSSEQASVNLKNLSVVIINYNGAAFLTQCLTALSIYYGNRLGEIIVLDNASVDNSEEKVTAFKQVSWVESGANLGYGGGTNRAFQITSSEYLAVLNPDVVVEPGCLEKMCRTLDDKSKELPVGIVGCKLLFPGSNPAEARIQHLAGGLAYPLALTHHIGAGVLEQKLTEIEGLKEQIYTSSQGDRVMEADYVTGALVVLRRSMFEQIGGYDELFSPAYYEETDLCLRARQAGWRVVSCLSARAIHHERSGVGGASLNYFFLYHVNRLRFVLKHYTPEQLKADFLPAEEQRLQAIWERYTAGSSDSAEISAEPGREFKGLQKAYFELKRQPLTAQSNYYDPSYELSGEVWQESWNGVASEDLAKVKAQMDLFLNWSQLESRTALISERWRLLNLPGLLGVDTKENMPSGGLFRRGVRKLRQVIYRQFTMPYMLEVTAAQERFNALVARQVTEMSGVIGQLVQNNPPTAPVSLQPWDERYFRETLAMLREVILPKVGQ